MTENATPVQKFKAAWLELFGSDTTEETTDVVVDAPAEVVEEVVDADVVVNEEPVAGTGSDEANTNVEVAGEEPVVEAVVEEVDWNAVVLEKDTRILELEAANDALRAQVESLIAPGAEKSPLDFGPDSEEEAIEAFWAKN